MIFNNSDTLVKISETTLREFIKNSQQILLELYEKFENSDDMCILDTMSILSSHELYYHLQYHQKIIINFLNIQQIDILNNFFISTYRVFLSKDISSDFFLILYKYIKNSCNKYLYSADMINIERIYNYLESNHENFIKYSQEKPNIELDALIKEFYQNALKGDFEQGVILCEPYCTNIDDFDHFFTTRITTLMNYVGYKWEIGAITFAIEHKITAYLDSILDYFITKLQTSHRDNAKTILITNAPNEEHTLGVKLISNSLIKLGYTLLRVDNNYTLEQLFNTIEKVKPDYVAFSATLVSNIYQLTTTIEKLNTRFENSYFKIIIGGKAFEHIEDPVSVMKADLYFSNIEKLVEYLKD